VSEETSPQTAHGKLARNERRKAAAGTIFTMGMAVLVGVSVPPLAAGYALEPGLLFIAVLAFVATQVAGHYILQGLED